MACGGVSSICFFLYDFSPSHHLFLSDAVWLLTAWLRLRSVPQLFKHGSFAGGVVNSFCGVRGGVRDKRREDARE